MPSRSHAVEKFEAFCADMPYHRLSQIVQILHQDGSVMVFHHATLWESEEGMLTLPDIDRKGYIGVCTEHCGNHLFHAGDLLAWQANHAAFGAAIKMDVGARIQQLEAENARLRREVVDELTRQGQDWGGY